MREWIHSHIRTLIVGIIVWLIGVIFLASPIAVTIAEASTSGVFDLIAFIENLPHNIVDFKSITKVFNDDIRQNFTTVLILYSIVIFAAMIIGIIKSKGKGEYNKREHGSSDWSKWGEEFKVLSKNKGLLLAEGHYLPLTKVGNINVLIVGGSGSRKVIILLNAKCPSVFRFIYFYRS